MGDVDFNEAIVQAIGDRAVPSIDSERLVEIYGDQQGAELADTITALVREATSMPIDWGDMTLAEGVRDILGRFGKKYPELSPQALHEIGRCVGWALR